MRLVACAIALLLSCGKNRRTVVNNNKILPTVSSPVDANITKSP